MIIEQFNPIDNNYNYESVAIIDRYISLTVQENWTKGNTMSLILPFNKEVFRSFELETILLIDNILYFVDNIESDGITITISGKSLIYKANERIINTNYSRQASPDIISGQLITDYVTSGGNPIGYLSYQASNLGLPSILFQNSYGEVLTIISELAETYGFGLVERCNLLHPHTEIEFKLGRDLSNVVEFSDVNENLTSNHIDNNNFDEKNVAIVLGEGEGSERRKVTVNNNITGLNRKELYVDARDLRQEELTSVQYDNLLRERGYLKLSERSNIFQLTGTIDTRSELFKIGVDYGLGDTVKINSQLFGVSYNAQITSIVRTWNEQGYFIDPIFGKSSPTVYEILKRK